eukprot:scaffold116128_cov16-Tisochrysis_lutea.AAC.1
MVACGSSCDRGVKAPRESMQCEVRWHVLTWPWTPGAGKPPPHPHSQAGRSAWAQAHTQRTERLHLLCTMRSPCKHKVYRRCSDGEAKMNNHASTAVRTG